MVYLSNAIERVQKRVVSLIYPYANYDDSLILGGIDKLSTRREKACEKLFSKIINKPDHKLAHLLQPKQEIHYNLRQSRVFTNYTANTNRFFNTFIPSSVELFNLNCK